MKLEGLDVDYKGVQFEPIPQLLEICIECGKPADKTQRKTSSSDRVVVGASDIYKARCRKCHNIPQQE